MASGGVIAFAVHQPALNRFRGVEGDGTRNAVYDQALAGRNGIGVAVDQKAGSRAGQRAEEFRCLRAAVAVCSIVDNKNLSSIPIARCRRRTARGIVLIP